jgi:hypothetical protein
MQRKYRATMMLRIAETIAYFPATLRSDTVRSTEDTHIRATAAMRRGEALVTAVQGEFFLKHISENTNKKTTAAISKQK